VLVFLSDLLEVLGRVIPCPTLYFSSELQVFQILQELVPKEFVFVLNTIGVRVLNTGEEWQKSVRVLQDGLPFLLSTLKELPQGLGRGEPFSKYAAKDLANCCFVCSLLWGMETDLFPGNSFPVLHQEVHCICIGMASSCTFCIKDPLLHGMVILASLKLAQLPFPRYFYGELAGGCT